LKEELIEKAISEIENPTFENTKQYLKVYSIEFENYKPKIERIDFESFEYTNAVYFPIKDELFFLVVYLSKENNEIIQVGTENGTQIYLNATSEILDFNQLSEIIKLKQLTGWSFNDLRPNGKSKYTFSCIKFEPHKSQAYELESKLKLLLTELEKDIDGILNLSKKANVIISVCVNQYISGNKGIHLDNKIISRLNKLNLGIDIDQYIYGKEIN
jgi:hypothetical protein